MVTPDAQEHPSEELTEERLRERYPVAEQLRPLDGFDVRRTSRKIVAFVVTEGDYGTALRFYVWTRKGSRFPWYVDRARQDTRDWNFENIMHEVQNLKQKYGL